MTEQINEIEYQLTDTSFGYRPNVFQDDQKVSDLRMIENERDCTNE